MGELANYTCKLLRARPMTTSSSVMSLDWVVSTDQRVAVLATYTPMSDGSYPFGNIRGQGAWEVYSANWTSYSGAVYQCPQLSDKRSYVPYTHAAVQGATSAYGLKSSWRWITLNDGLDNTTLPSASNTLKIMSSSEITLSGAVSMWEVNLLGLTSTYSNYWLAPIGNPEDDAGTKTIGVTGWQSSTPTHKPLAYAYASAPTNYARRAKYYGIVLYEYPIYSSGLTDTMFNNAVSTFLAGNTPSSTSISYSCPVSTINYGHAAILIDSLVSTSATANSVSSTSMTAYSTNKRSYLAPLNSSSPADYYSTGLSYYSAEYSNLFGMYLTTPAVSSKCTISAPQVLTCTDAYNYKRYCTVKNNNPIGLVLFWTGNKTSTTTMANWGNSSTTLYGQLAACYVGPGQTVKVLVADQAWDNDQYIGFFFCGLYRTLSTTVGDTTADVVVEHVATTTPGNSAKLPLVSSLNMPASDTTPTNKYSYDYTSVRGKFTTATLNTVFPHRAGVYILEEPLSSGTPTNLTPA